MYVQSDQRYVVISAFFSFCTIIFDNFLYFPYKKYAFQRRGILFIYLFLLWRLIGCLVLDKHVYVIFRCVRHKKKCGLAALIPSVNLLDIV